MHYVCYSTTWKSTLLFSLFRRTKKTKNSHNVPFQIIIRIHRWGAHKETIGEKKKENVSRDFLDPTKSLRKNARNVTRQPTSFRVLERDQCQLFVSSTPFFFVVFKERERNRGRKGDGFAFVCLFFFLRLVFREMPRLNETRGEPRQANRDIWIRRKHVWSHAVQVWQNVEEHKNVFVFF